jgi:hypothetical protein
MVVLFAVILAATVNPRAETPAESALIDGYEKVGFDRLASFNFNPPANDVAAADQTKSNEQIPGKIKALDERKVAVTGFMLPVKMDGGLVKEFLLVKDPMLCCYGVMPKVNEWVVVKMTGKGVPALMDVPITFEGKLKVGMMMENGYLTGIYLLEGERQAETKG